MPIRVLMPEPARLHSGYHAELTTHPPADVHYQLTNQVLYCPVESLHADGGRRQLFAAEDNPRAYDAFDNIPVFLPPLVDMADVIHSFMHPVLNDKPFVVDLGDFLFPWTVTASEFSRMKRLEISCAPAHVDKDRLSRLAAHLRKPNCHRILAWHTKARQDIFRWIDDESIRRKVEVMHPTVKPRETPPRDNQRVRIMFCGSAAGMDSFIRKGGDDVFRLFMRLQGELDVELCYVGFVPRAVQAAFADSPRIQIHTRLSKEDLFAEYARSDIFLLPSRFDTFGMACLEAMNHELPIVASVGEQFPSDAVVDDRRGGYLVPMSHREAQSDHITELLGANYSRPKTPSINLGLAEERLRELVQQSDLRREMGQYNKQQILTGRYSMDQRNRRLAQIYREALAEA